MSAPSAVSTPTGLTVLRWIEKNPDPLLTEIVAAFCDADDFDAASAVRRVVRDLVVDSLLRMKDSDIDHDWAYRLTRSGRAFLARTSSVTQ